MTRRLIDLTGRTFGRLTVLARGENNATGHPRWICSCVCGGGALVRGSHLSGGQSQSCGCTRQKGLAHGGRTTHGMTGTATYRSWAAMIARCEYPSNPSYERYGADGITVCDEWRRSFAAFYRDMGARPAGKTLDRIKNEKGYEPGNCRWSTPSEQAFNRRPKGWRLTQATPEHA